MSDFQRIRAAAALEGEVDDERVNVTPGFAPRPRRSAIDQIHDLQNAARARATRSFALANRYALVGIVLIVVGSSIGPEWARAAEWIAGVGLASRGWWLWEIGAHARVEASVDATAFLADSDR